MDKLTVPRWPLCAIRTVLRLKTSSLYVYVYGWNDEVSALCRDAQIWSFEMSIFVQPTVETSNIFNLGKKKC